MQIRTLRPPFSVQGSFLKVKNVRLILLFETKMLLFAWKYAGLLALHYPADRWLAVPAKIFYITLWAYCSSLYCEHTLRQGVLKSIPAGKKYRMLEALIKCPPCFQKRPKIYIGMDLSLDIILLNFLHRFGGLKITAKHARAL